MSVLNHPELAQLVQRKVITNVEPSQINAASIDVTLGHHLLIEELQGDTQIDLHKSYLVDLRARTPIHTRSYTMPSDDGYLLRPGEFILAHTRELFFLPNNICCEYKLKSSMARVGLEHLTAGWCDPGWHGSALTLELKNMTRNHVIRIRPGDRIGQVVFFATRPVPADKTYAAKGRYNNDRTVMGVKP